MTPRQNIDMDTIIDAIKLIPVWTVYTTEDEYGRRGRMVGIFDTAEAANAAAKGKGWYGGHGDVAQGTALQIGNLTYFLAIGSAIKLNVDLVKTEKEEIAAAKAKLTDREKQLLGIKA